ncbi:oxidoreductase [Streptomyces flavofungini]|uniref:NAD(P)-binding domain-containing protein n=1 Tax=Streptomyces flavofungini TaxID=68200 RepID=A0ABS0X0L1_9ACTN|nr:NAD(P)-binding domain-containing protein [Streptomyces flavofungini]MBJ3806717.1 NAD(P)-binding domain-containing protein [Streptomyces flavofungini]GHC60995.1 oxidoreductase [Streptomyces flavofungini]
MHIALIGTGNVGRALAKAWAAAGHDVALGSRHPEAKKDLAEELGVPVIGIGEAAARAEVVVNVTPGAESIAALRTAGAESLAGKLLIDIAVGFTEEPHGMALSHPTVSLAEEIQSTFPEAQVVKTLSTMDSVVMTSPDSLAGPSTVFLSGDNPTAKSRTALLLTDLGWPPSSHLDLGPLETARGQEHFAHLFMGIAVSQGTYGFNVRVVPPKAE